MTLNIGVVPNEDDRGRERNFIHFPAFGSNLLGIASYFLQSLSGSL
jgi:hypothetical protein